MSRRELYSNLRFLSYRILQEKSRFSYEDFLSHQKYFNDGLVSMIAYLLLYDQMFFLDRMLVEEFRQEKEEKGDFTCLDVACGTGIMLKVLRLEKLFDPVSFYCLEYNSGCDEFFSQVKEILKCEFSLDPSHLLEADMASYPGPEKKHRRFDFVYAMGLLPMLPEPESVIRNLVSLTEKNGKVFFDFYHPEGSSILENGKKIKNIELGAIWIASSEIFKSGVKKQSDGRVDFSVNRVYEKFSRNRPRRVVRNLPLTSYIHKIFDILFWNPVYFWYPVDYIYNILKKIDGIDIIEFKASEKTSKTAVLLKKT